MELNELNSSLNFIEGENGLLYKNLDGFLYTILKKPEQAVIYVNLPQVSRNEKKMISAYLKESAMHYIKSHFVKEGIQINFNLAILEDPDYILQFTKLFSAYLSSASIEFSNADLDVAFDKNMYAFLPVEKPIDDCKKLKTEKPCSNDKKSFLKGVSTQVILIVIFGVLALIYGVISLFAIRFAAAVGYLMGWLPTLVMVHRKYRAKTIYLTTILVSFIVLLLSTVYIFLFYFLSQQDIYTAAEYVMQSLTPAHCLFNMALAFLLSVFGAYSTVPAKKKKTIIDEDFT